MPTPPDHDNCPELTAELKAGQAAAHALAQHLRRMGCESATLTLFIEDEKYEVTCTHHPVSDDPA